MKAILKKISLIILGSVLAVALIEVGLRIAGFAFLGIQKYRNYCSIKQRGAYRIMCVGESTTAGDYPFFLERILNQYNIGLKFSVVNCGVPGMTTALILSEIEKNIKKYKPDMVVTMMGINDGTGHIPADLLIVSMKDAPFFNKLRIYKLARYLWLALTRVQPWGVKRDFANRKEQSIAIVEGNAPRYTRPDLSQQHVETGQWYHILGRYIDAEAEFKKAIALNPNNTIAYGYLIWTYNDWGHLEQAEALFKQAIRVNPNNFEAYFWMGIAYRIHGEYGLAVDCFKKAMEISPQHESPYVELYPIYMQRKEYNRAEELLKKAISSNAKTARIYGALSSLYRQMEEYSLSNEYAVKAEELSYYKASTVNNYKQLWKILEEKNIRLVCVQYPMRKLWPLKKIFLDQDGIIFVDNEQTFRNAVNNAGYKEYFIDMFGGNFGHCTAKGNQLLAGNIAKAIVKEVFSK